MAADTASPLRLVFLRATSWPDLPDFDFVSFVVGFMKLRNHPTNH
jgi:hypothetical protein